MKPVCQRLLVIGLGLIGGSLALAARRSGAAPRVLAISRSPATIATGLAHGLIDDGDTGYGRLLDELQAGDIIVVATPVLSLPAVFAELNAVLARGVIVSDAASVKGSVMDAARAAFGGLPPTLVPGHPIAGSEQSGVAAARPELFRQRRVILTPAVDAAPAAVAAVRALWQAVGAEVVLMTAERHDAVLAATSHLPHVLAYALVDMLAGAGGTDAGSEDIFRFAAGGFRDFTRIAASDPQMWHDIVLANRPALLAEMDRYRRALETLRADIATADSAALLQRFSRARVARLHFADLFEYPDSPDSDDTPELS